jgi:hypothetical protein
MVKSTLNSSITYVEDKGISRDDLEKDGQLYEYDIAAGLTIHLAVGNYCYDYVADKNVIYFPIYLVKDGEKIVTQIGVFEMMSVDLPNVLDSESDIDLNALNDPLLYSFATPEFLSKYAIVKEPKSSQRKQKQTEDTDEYVIPLQQDVEEQLFDVPLGVFEDDEEPEPLFAVDETTNWVQKLMRSSKYGIVDNEGGGDCLFACLRDAYARVGRVMSVAKLREMVSIEATEELFMNYKTLHDSFNKEVSELATTKEKIKEDAKTMSETGKAEKNRIKKRAIVGEIGKIKEYLKDVVGKLAAAKERASEFNFMKGINNLASFKKKIKTCSFWGDVWAIHTLERVLKIKTIILSSENYNKDDLTNVLLCGQLDDNVEKFEPEYYIILDHTGSHYRLITYSSKTIFKYDDLPRSIKHKIVDTCLVKKVGYYNIIPEFKKLKEERMKRKITHTPTNTNTNTNTNTSN